MSLTCLRTVSTVTPNKNHCVIYFTWTDGANSLPKTC